MTQEQGSTEFRKVEKPFAVPREFTEMGRKTFEMMVDMRKGILESLLLLHRQCLAHADADAKLMSGFMTKFATAKSIPDAASACQEYANRRAEIFADDARQFLAAADKVAGQKASVDSVTAQQMMIRGLIQAASRWQLHPDGSSPRGGWKPC